MANERTSQHRSVNFHCYAKAENNNLCPKHPVGCFCVMIVYAKASRLQTLLIVKNV